jgi:hypothetical protein
MILWHKAQYFSCCFILCKVCRIVFDKLVCDSKKIAKCTIISTG